MAVRGLVRDVLRSERSVRRYRLSWNAFIEADDSEHRLVVEIPRKGGSFTSSGELGVVEVLRYVAAEVEPKQLLLVDGKPSLEMIGLVELIVKALGRAARKQWERLVELEKALKELERGSDPGDVCERYELGGCRWQMSDEEVRKLVTKSIEETRTLFNTLVKLERIAMVLLTGLRVGKPYLDALEIRINAPEYEGPLKKLLSQQQGREQARQPEARPEEEAELVQL